MFSKQIPQRGEEADLCRDAFQLADGDLPVSHGMIYSADICDTNVRAVSEPIVEGRVLMLVYGMFQTCLQFISV